MISVQKAKELVLEHSKPLETINIPLEKALNYTLAENVYASIDLPSFKQSAMDGYAVHLSTIEQVEFNLIGEVAAGSSITYTLNPGDAVRIFTGAPVPESANAVIMQEWIEQISPSKIKLNKIAKPPFEGMNIRPKGEQIKKGAIALKQGTTLNSAGLGYLQSFGYKDIEVVKKPTIALIITGNELVKAGQELSFGQIYESNSITIQSALKNAGFETSTVLFAKDSLEETIAQIEKARREADTVLISGGISVGDYDFVETALHQLEVEQLFYKIAQKPGKPLFFGKSNKQLFFGLPGNPASALVCLYEYVIPALKKQSGFKDCLPFSIKLPISEDFEVKGNRDLFLKARIENNQVIILDKQASSMLHSFALANALVYLPFERGNITKNELVEVHLL